MSWEGGIEAGGSAVVMDETASLLFLISLGA